MQEKLISRSLFSARDGRHAWACSRHETANTQEPIQCVNILIVRGFLFTSELMTCKKLVQCMGQLI